MNAGKCKMETLFVFFFAHSATMLAQKIRDRIARDNAALAKASEEERLDREREMETNLSGLTAFVSQCFRTFADGADPVQSTFALSHLHKVEPLTVVCVQQTGRVPYVHFSQTCIGDDDSSDPPEAMRVARVFYREAIQKRAPTLDFTTGDIGVDHSSLNKGMNMMFKTQTSFSLWPSGV